MYTQDVLQPSEITLMEEAHHRPGLVLQVSCLRLPDGLVINQSKLSVVEHD